MTKTTRKKRQPLYSQTDRDNIRWFWHSYLKKHSGWLLVVLGMILAQGFVYQQFLSMTENGLRVIFEAGAMRELVMVCIVVFFLFAVRGLMSFLVPLVTV
ncbi:MAG: ABC transporter ATP-binding protein, partial [Pseudomonadota bacterium]